jgi:hypothetical protein
VIDTKDRRLIEHAVQRHVQSLRGNEITTKGLFEYDARVVRATGLSQAVYDHWKHTGWNRQVMHGSPGIPQLLANRRIGSRFPVVSVDVAKRRGQFREHNLVYASVFLQAFARVSAKPVEVPTGARHADDRDVETTTSRHGLQRREDLLVGEVTASTEENQRIRAFSRTVHGFFST